MLFGVAVWAMLIYIVEVLVGKNDFVRKLFKGSSVRLMKDGNLDLKKMKKNHIEMEQLLTMLRQQGVYSLKEVRDIYLETGRSISIKKYLTAEPPTAEMLQMEVEDEDPTIFLVDEGSVQENMLNFIGKSKEWLYEQSETEGLSDPKNVVYAEWSEANGLFVKTYS